ncbi:MAG TPA: autotransporter domain-containing protein, partial [Stellaceae bacterium]|nr:autotransporter domain-containing protein [Stellaceae bacterium]
GTTGAGGAGISGSDLTITTAGSIAGGLGGDGVTQANAITFTGGTNSLALQSGYSITGNVVGTGNDTLALGGTANATFDVSNIGAAAQYQGFSTFQKIGTSTWTLTNTTTAVTPWTISAGVLNASSDAALGDTGGTLTLNGGTLQFGAAFNMPSRNISLGASGGTFDTNGFTIAIGAGIAGSGGLTKNGAGTLNLGAPNSYTGGTTVNAGTLVVVSGASLASTGAITVNGGTLDFDGNTQTVSSISGTGGSISLGPAGSTNGLTVNQNSNTSYNGNISGAGTFTKTGTGTLILNGANTFSGPTTVSGGTLEIGDASHTSASLTSNVTIGASGTLMGHGTFAGGVTNTAGGTIAPGGSIGTLTVASYTQGAGSTLQIEVSPSAASKLNVTGAASLNGTLVLIYDPGVYSSATFAIVHAGSITGTFATVNASGSVPTNVSQAVTYTGTDVNLVLTGSSTLVVRPTNDTIFSSLNTSVLLGGQQANTMLLGHLSDNHSGTGSDTIETALASTNPTQLAFNGGAMHLNDAVAQLPDAMAQFGGWFRAVGNFASLSSASVPGVDTQGGGFMAGLDRPIAPNLTAGIAAGYSHTNLSQHDSENGTLDTPRIAAYGSYAMGPWAFDATVGYAYDHVSEKRPLAGIGTASSSHDAHEATGAAQASYRFDYAGFAIMPNAGLAYVHLFDGGLTESGTPGFNLDVMHRNSDSLRPFIGVSASEPITTSGMRLVPEADIRYSHELFATAPSLVFVGGGNFAVNGITPSHDLLTLGGGVTAAMSDRLDLFADYHATLPTGNYWQQTISAGARYKF